MKYEIIEKFEGQSELVFDTDSKFIAEEVMEHYGMVSQGANYSLLEDGIEIESFEFKD